MFGQDLLGQSVCFSLTLFFLDSILGAQTWRMKRGNRFSLCASYLHPDAYGSACVCECVCVTCVVVLGAVSEVWFIFEDELWEREALGHLNRSVLLPLKDQVVHGVTDWNTKLMRDNRFKKGHRAQVCVRYSSEKFVHHLFRLCRFALLCLWTVGVSGQQTRFPSSWGLHYSGCWTHPRSPFMQLQCF